MKVTTHYIAFWALLILAGQAKEQWVSAFSILTAIASLIVHYAITWEKPND